MEKMILTDGGNLLRHCDLGWYFQKPNGEFIREVSEDEAAFLTKNGHEIDFHFQNEHPTEFPVWKFLKSICVCNDYSNYRAETSCNGGDYAHYENEDWFVGKVNGKTVFRYVKRYRTSAEFGYDELNGSYQQNLGSIHVINSNVPERYVTQCQYWDQELEENVYDVYEVLETISEVGTFKQLWNATCVDLPSKFEPEEEQVEYSALSLTSKKLILKKLKDFGIDLRESYYRSKNPKKGWIKSSNRR